jgi:hypothetical protein
MTQQFEPVVHPVAIRKLRPTQMTIGMAEVEKKREGWRARRDRDGTGFLGDHSIPVVIGPRDRYWIIDHHHLVRALHEEGVEHVLVRVLADLSHLSKRLFGTFMDSRNWLHPFDADGHRQPVDDLPKHIEDLIDDPYRSLAGELRRMGGYAKVDTPYTEFLWADFLRTQIKRDLVKRDFPSALLRAIDLADGKACAYLPGWAGKDD